MSEYKKKNWKDVILIVETYTLLGFACLLTLEMGKVHALGFIMLIEEIITENYSNWDPKDIADYSKHLEKTFGVR